MKIYHRGLGALQVARKASSWSPLSQTSFRCSSHRSAQHESHSITSASTIFSGIQPTGVPHIGNWLGALQQWVDLQKSEARLVFSVVDLHALTLPKPAEQLRRWRQETLATFLAIGLDPERCTLFFQSDSPSHAELMWILSCTTSLGYLSRMTSWKSKASIPDGVSALDTGAKAKAKLGLLAYPVLQAADILVHGATFVPVGADQVQHLEFARECARNFNAACGQPVFQEPQVLLSPAARVMSLRDPCQKMSKSDPDPRSRILLTDGHDIIRAKVRAALTDSITGYITYQPETRPGIANLLNLLSYFSRNQIKPAEYADRLKDHSMRAVKELVADQVSRQLLPVREAYAELMETAEGRQKLDAVASSGAAAARESANKTMKKVYKAIGLL